MERVPRPSPDRRDEGDSRGHGAHQPAARFAGVTSCWWQGVAAFQTKTFLVWIPSRPCRLREHDTASLEAEDSWAGGRVQPVPLHERRLAGQEEEGEGQVGRAKGERAATSLFHQRALLQLQGRSSGGGSSLDMRPLPSTHLSARLPQTSIFTPSFGTSTKVRISSRLTTDQVIEQLLNKFKVSFSRASFELLCQSDGTFQPQGGGHPLWHSVQSAPERKITYNNQTDLNKGSSVLKGNHPARNL